MELHLVGIEPQLDTQSTVKKEFVLLTFQTAISFSEFEKFKKHSDCWKFGAEFKQVK